MNGRRSLRAELAPLDEEFAAEVLAGLSREPKSLPCRYFYDARGSELFEEITELAEYYPTRAELAILRDHAGEIAARVAPGAVLVEFGSGSSRKTEILLDAMPGLAAYVAIDVSACALEGARSRLEARYPRLRVITRTGDFRMPLDLPAELAKAPRLGFFPGSTIGNLTREEAVGLMVDMRRAPAPRLRPMSRMRATASSRVRLPMVEPGKKPSLGAPESSSGRASGMRKSPTRVMTQSPG